LVLPRLCACPDGLRDYCVDCVEHQPPTWLEDGPHLPIQADPIGPFEVPDEAKRIDEFILVAERQMKCVGLHEVHRCRYGALAKAARGLAKHLQAGIEQRRLLEARSDIDR